MEAGPESWFRIKAIADTDYDLAEANYQAAEANVAVGEAVIKQNKAILDLAKTNLGYTIIKSPVKGTIIDRRVNVGQTVVASLNAPSLFLIAKDLRRCRSGPRSTRPTSGKIHVGMPVSSRSTPFPGRNVPRQGGADPPERHDDAKRGHVYRRGGHRQFRRPLLPYLTANVQFEDRPARGRAAGAQCGAALEAAERSRSTPRPSRRRLARGPQRDSNLGPPARPTPPSRPTTLDEQGRLWVASTGFVRPLEVVVGPTDGTMTEVSGSGLRKAWRSSWAKEARTTRPQRYHESVHTADTSAQVAKRDGALGVPQAVESTPMELIRLEDIHKTYHLGEVDVPVLRGVSLSIARGEMVALMGASGSGKTTLMNILGCLDHPSSGKYWLDGREMSDLTPNERALVRTEKLGFVFQNFNLLPRTTALQNVTMPLDYAPQRPATARGDAAWPRACSQRVGLADRVEHEPSQMSGGQQQRVAIGRALVNQPALVLADEPTGNLDSHTSVEILRMFQQLNAEGITVVLVTHDPKVAAYAHRTIRIEDGLIEDQQDNATASWHVHGGDGRRGHGHAARPHRSGRRGDRHRNPRSGVSHRPCRRKLPSNATVLIFTPAQLGPSPSAKRRSCIVDASRWWCRPRSAPRSGRCGATRCDPA